MTKAQTFIDLYNQLSPYNDEEHELALSHCTEALGTIITSPLGDFTQHHTFTDLSIAITRPAPDPSDDGDAPDQPFIAELLEALQDPDQDELRSA